MTTALVFRALASGQSAPNHFQLPETLGKPTPDLLRQRIESMTLLNGPNVTGAKPRPAPLRVEIVGKAAVCAIPLLNAMPAYGGADLKMRMIIPPADPIDHMPVARGIPACSQKR